MEALLPWKCKDGKCYGSGSVENSKLRFAMFSWGGTWGCTKVKKKTCCKAPWNSDVTDNETKKDLEEAHRLYYNFPK